MLALAARGWPLAGLERDTALSAYLARPDQRSYDLADLTLRYLKRELKAGGRPTTGQLSLDGIDDDAARRDRDAARPRGARPRGGARRRARGARRHRRCSPTSSCRWSTCSPAWSRPASPSTSTTSRRWRASSPTGSARPREDAYAVIGKEINLGSPKQLQVVLFDELGMPKTKRTKTGYTTDADALQGALREDRAPVPRRTCSATAT